ncbi:hypothetical protein [Rhizobium leguminosarum]|uniref:hypothetical protein n=1 Tax=Rhizobium leguminosarum TaxID=384 RepID=UPI001C964DDE|nr:hypothetical protein [Rhizobium leguminosarum]MBY5660951.1 hypothetical protein [Rhizobium leguminosarum]MBY5674987.1 hypothetical protein [Rhizobium leguminosarum]
MAGAPCAQATNLLEQAITLTQPCRSLKGKLDLGLTKVDLGIDNIDRVEVETLRIAVDGDAAEVSARGTLACKTSDDATFKGGFKATVEAHVTANICVLRHRRQLAEHRQGRRQVRLSCFWFQGSDRRGASRRA